MSPSAIGRHARHVAVMAVMAVGLVRPGLAPDLRGHERGGPASAVGPRFELGAPSRSAFPSDLHTVPDPRQRTGLRVALPLPNCRREPSVCDDLRLLNELDGFDLDPRLALPFTGPVDLGSVTVRSVFLVRLDGGSSDAIPVERMVYDARAHTLYARPGALLEPERRYGLVVTRGLRDTLGRALRRSVAFQRFLRGETTAPRAGAYRRRLAELMAVLEQRGLGADEVAVASVFTTGSVTGFLQHARAALDRDPPPPALITAPESGGRAYFARDTIRALTLRRQVRVGTTDAFETMRLPLELLPPTSVGGLGVGWYWSRRYLDADRRIPEGPTVGPPAAAPAEVPVPFLIVLPAGSAPSGGWPVVLVGHGYGGEMFSTALRVAETFARHGIATAAVTVVGHGGGPEGALIVTRRDGSPARVRVPGRGIDQDGDGQIGATEGLAPPDGGPLASLSLRDGLRQQVVDLMAFVRAVSGGIDADGDGVRDTRGDRIFYLGQSLGGIYGTLFLAVEPRVEVGVLTVPGGPVTEIARLSPAFRPLVREALERRRPPLGNGDRDFREDLPLRGEPSVTDLARGALAIQEYLARVEWLSRRGDPLGYVRHLRLAPLPGQVPKRVLIQFAWGDGIVPNPTTSALIRAGRLADRTTLLRYDRVVDAAPGARAEPHGFLLRVGVPGVPDALARAAQEQVARFFLAGGVTIWDPDSASPPPFSNPVFETPATVLPDRVSVLGGARRD